MIHFSPSVQPCDQTSARRRVWHALALTASMVLVAGLLAGFVQTCQESVQRGQRLEQQFRAQAHPSQAAGRNQIAYFRTSASTNAAKSSSTGAIQRSGHASAPINVVWLTRS